MNAIKVLKSETDHENAIARLAVLMDVETLSSDLENELEVLSVLIEQYESREYPDVLPSPTEAIKFRMDQAGLKNKDLIEYIGSASKVSEVLNGKRTLSLNMIRNLCSGLGIPAEVLIQDKSQETAFDKDVAWSSFPVVEMNKKGYFDEVYSSSAYVKEYGEELVTKFLSTVQDGFKFQPTLLRTSAHHRGNKKSVDHHALWAWQAKVLKKANSEAALVEFDAGAIDAEWLRKLAQLSWSDSGPYLAKEFLNKYGIYLVFEPHLSRTYLDGAVCFSEKKNPVVSLTLRHRRLDNFWFTLMHEMSHIALHMDAENAWFLDNFEANGSDVDDVEKEADDLARKSLIPDEIWASSTVDDASDVVELARELSISPCVVAGRARYEAGSYSLFGAKFRADVPELV